MTAASLSETRSTLPVFKIVSICTSHITANDDKLFRDIGRGLWVYCGDSDFGWVCYVPDTEKDLNDELAHMRSLGFSGACLELFRQAYQQRARFIRFDAEAASVDGWPTFDW